MKNPRNKFKEALKEGRHQLGIWNTIGGNTVPEMLGGAGYDWVLIDCEHSPIEAVEILPALQAIAGSSETSAIVRPTSNDPVLFKRILDMGVQTLLVPYIQSGDEARAAVTAMRYSPRGIRGLAAMTRATRYGKVDDYFSTAAEELCLIVQVETAEGLSALEEIASVDGVDGVFIGPADLSASMGHPGEVNHPDVVAAIEQSFNRLEALNVPAGIMALDPVKAKNWIRQGSTFTAVGVDLVLLAESAEKLRLEF